MIKEALWMGHRSSKSTFCANNTRPYIFKESSLPNPINTQGPVLAYIITDWGSVSKLLQGFIGLVGPDEYNMVHL